GASRTSSRGADAQRRRSSALLRVDGAGSARRGAVLAAVLVRRALGRGAVVLAGPTGETLPRVLAGPTRETLLRVLARVRRVALAGALPARALVRRVALVRVLARVARTGPARSARGAARRRAVPGLRR